MMRNDFYFQQQCPMRKHRGIGIASFVVGVISATLGFFIFLGHVALHFQIEAWRESGALPSLHYGLLMLMYIGILLYASVFIIIVGIVGLGLGIGQLFISGKKSFAAAGIIMSITGSLLPVSGYMFMFVMARI